MSKRICKNCLKETEFKNGVCPHCFNQTTCCTCGGQMSDVDDYGNEGHFCPNDCAFEVLVEDLQSDPSDEGPAEQPPETYDDDTEYNLPDTYITKSSLIFCWNCKEETIETGKAQRDKVAILGFICPDCNCSIREDPKLLISIAKRLGMTPDQWRLQYLKEMVDDLLTLPK